MISAVRAFLAAGQRRSRAVDRPRLRRARDAARLPRRARGDRARRAGHARDDRSRASTTNARARPTSCSPASNRANSTCATTKSAKRWWRNSRSRIRGWPTIAQRSRRAACSSSPAASRAGDLPWLPRAVARLRARNASGRTVQPADRTLSRSGARLGRGRRHRAARGQRRVAADARSCARPTSRSNAARTSCTCARPAPTASRSGSRGGTVFVDTGSLEAGFSIPGLAPARARRSRDLRAAGEARQAARDQRRRAGHAGRPQGRRLRRARRARHRPVSRPAQRDDPRRDQRLSRSASTPAPTACSCRCIRCIR